MEPQRNAPCVTTNHQAPQCGALLAGGAPAPRTLVHSSLSRFEGCGAMVRLAPVGADATPDAAIVARREHLWYFAAEEAAQLKAALPEMEWAPAGNEWKHFDFITLTVSNGVNISGP